MRTALLHLLPFLCPPWLIQEAEDLVHGALLRVVEAAGQHGGRVILDAYYLRKAAHSAVVDEIRRRQRRREITLEGELGQTLPGSVRADPEHAAEALGVGGEILDCLRHLVPLRRRAVSLYLYGHSVPETARLLGWPLKKTENMVFRGMADLRRCLSAKGLRP